MKMYCRILLLLQLGLLNSCILFFDGDLKKPATTQTSVDDGLVSNITNLTVDQANKQIIITGTDLDKISQIKIQGTGVDETFNIATQTSTTIEITATQALAFVIGSVFDLLITEASGASGTFSLTFDLLDDSVTTSKILDGEVKSNDIENGAVTFDKLSTSGAVTGEAIVFDGSNWTTANISGLTFKGTWDSSSDSPDLDSALDCGTGSSGGDFYVVSIGSTSVTNLDGIDAWSAGDWAVCNSSGDWEKIANSSNVTSVFGKTGVVTADLDDMDDVAYPITPATDGELLIWDNTESRWENAANVRIDPTSGNLTVDAQATLGVLRIDDNGSDGTYWKIQEDSSNNLIFVYHLHHR